MNKPEKLQQRKFYHIYNHAVADRDLFRTAEHYEHFLELYERFIDPIAETFAWALMPNHFHFLIKIKENVCYKHSNYNNQYSEEKFNDIKWETKDLSSCAAPDKVKTPSPEKHISHLCNAYARYFNKREQKSGILFERPFHRKNIDNSAYLKNAILYIHNNPVHHGFREHPVEYPWTSYLTCVSIKPTKLNRDEVLGWFSKDGDFKTKHNEEFKWKEFESWLEL